METLDAIGHGAYALILLGLFCIGRGQRVPKLARWGWPMRIVGEATWVVIGVILADQGIVFTSIILWGVVFVIVDFYGWAEARAMGD